MLVVVDDECAICDFLEEMLNIIAPDEGVKTFTSGCAAVEWYRMHWQDVKAVLLDINIPDMNGLGERAGNPTPLGVG